MTSQHTNITIKGYVVAAPKKQGSTETAGIAIQDENGTEYYVYPKGLGLDLVESINVGVEAVGSVTEIDDCKFILVRNYQVQDEYDDEWYDDSDE